ncbi:MULTISPECIES: substrate-binding domain-containing protein [unclassified Rathayibacter]|uniref:substrate-binding domain-containing protein n=1 Tax=unclassified Rathayibacter TaxID=2609250 RepID=UPI0011AFE953|nr:MULTISPECIES: substrate-binding domain-containing protein [unclassified Rathayibacter]
MTNAVAVLTLLGEGRRPLTVTAIARELDLPRTSVDRICETLSVERLLSRGTDGTFWLGPRVATSGAVSRGARPRSLRLGVLVPDLGNAYYGTFITAVEADAQAAGDEVLVHDARDDVDEQRRQWQVLLDDDVDVILVDSVATHGFDDLVRASSEQGVPVIAIGTRIAGVDVSVTSDNTQAGVLAGLELAQHLPPGARIAIVDGLQKNANAERIAGFLDALSDHPDLHVVGRQRGRVEDEESGRDAVERLLAEHGPLDGVFAVCDPLALGVADRVAGRPQRTSIVSVDGRSRAVQEILAGGAFLATVAQDPAKLGTTAMASARDVCEGFWPHQRVVSLPVQLITRSDAARYEAWG